MYQPETAVAAFEPGECGARTPEAKPRNVADWVSFQLHREALERFVPSGSRVLELGAGDGRFTEVLQRLGCTISVVEDTPEEIEAGQARAAARGLGASIEAWYPGGAGALDAFPDGAYDVVVAYAGTLSYALERRDRALSAYRRLIRPGGVLALSVMSLWGTLRRDLACFLGQDLVENRAIIRSGNLAVGPLGASRPCHLFRAAELDAFLRRGGLDVLALAASSALSTGLDLPLGGDPSTWSALLEFERAACVERGYVDSGRHLIAVGRR